MRTSSQIWLHLLGLVLFFAYSTMPLAAQGKITCRLGRNIYQRELEPVIGLTEAEAIRIVNEILRLDNKSATLIKTQAAKVSNAEVCLMTEETSFPFRILFSTEFFSQLYADTPEVWANKAILAHEVGHIVNNDFINTDSGSTPEIELRADEYAGKVLARMGATLNQALAAYRSKRLQDFKDSDSYPSLEERVTRVTVGWRNEKDGSVSRVSEVEKNAREVNKQLEDLERTTFKLKPVSILLLGMRCSLNGVHVSSTNATNIYECISERMKEEDQKKYEDQLFETLKLAFVGREFKMRDSHIRGMLFTRNDSRLREVFLNSASNEDGHAQTLEFLLTWEGKNQRPYTTTNVTQSTIALGKQIEARISNLEAADISSAERSFSLGEFSCSSDYDVVETEEVQENRPRKVTFECKSPMFGSLSIRKQKLREMFDSVEYAIRGRDYSWQYGQGDDSWLNYSYNQGEYSDFNMPNNPTRNRLSKISVFEDSYYSKILGTLTLRFTILK